MKKVIMSMGVFGLILMISGFARNQDVQRKPRKLSDTRAGLQLSIELAENIYHSKDTARLSVTLRNVGRDPIILLEKMAWGGSSGFSLALLDKNNKELPRTFIDDAFVGRSFSPEDFISIPPGRSVQRDRGVDLRAYGIKKPGSYQLIVWFRSPVSQRQAPEGLNVWTSDKGLLVSKSVSFTVID